MSRKMRWAWMILSILILVGAISAFAAANIVPVTRLGQILRANTANDFKPPECAALNLNNIVVGSGNINGTNQNDLILGSPFVDIINGRNGAECILGGGGDDYIEGRQGNDVILGGPGDDNLFGGPGNDYLIGGPGNDYCEGGAGTDTFDPSCEIQIQ
ncbi:calcium-binding protein [Anaerolinea sp.]|uniref:calcium-binding protein n=1 Tax=Anaerolinea sp. TaxID=1872519 RepID=UPI002ACD8093|nr:calcium-binding protein [Anaerolinea sp.]